MSINRKRVREQFASYVKNYNPTDPKISLKIAHTYRVADHCENIASSIGLSDEDIDFSWLSGMIHDIGRFEQVRRYNTFSDLQSVDHAEFGADLLFGDEFLIKGYADDSSLYPLLDTVIRQHNKFIIDESISGKTLIFCNILRDADKVDIFRVNVETPMEDIYNVSSEELMNSSVSEEVMEYVMAHSAVKRDVVITPADHLIGHIALAFELVYPKSRELLKEQGYLDKLFEFKSDNENTIRALEQTREEIERVMTS